MSDREKLIELLDDSPGIDTIYSNYERDADWLLANGVTVQRWIPVTERLPEDDLPTQTERVQIRCLVFTNKGSVKTCSRQRCRTKRNGVWGYTAWEWSKADFAKPTHWMPLPEPPKESAE